MDPRQKRIQDLNELLQDDYALLRKLEKAYRLEDDPRRKEKYKSEIEDLNVQINERKEDIQSLTIELQNTLLHLPDEEPVDQFNDDKVSGLPADLLALAIQYHTEIEKKQSRLANISNWFIAGNEVGPDQCDSATRFLSTVSEAVQKFSTLLDETTSADIRVDIVQFRYLLITPLHSSMKMLNDLARLIPAFSQDRTGDRIVRQAEIRTDLSALEEGLKEINIHMTHYVYKMLLDLYDPPKLKSLYLKLGITYKDAVADSREMKINKLIEYCKRNGKYEELIREVQVEHSHRLPNKSNTSYRTSSA
jgi:Effector-associated domain 7